MTTLSRPRVSPAPAPGARPAVASFLVPVGVLLAAIVVLAVRLAFVTDPLSSDESGYLTVGAGWHAGGTSLYGNYWVDRPPLLITIFRTAALLGGAVPLRVIGALAAAVAVTAVGWTAHRLSGRRAGTCAAVVAAAFLVSPRAGATAVNGELLAAPFIAVGIAVTVRATLSETRRSMLLCGAAAGGCAVAAVLVKQNMVDVAVFAGVLALLAVRAVGVCGVARIASGFAAGALGTAAVMAAWTAAHGTSLRGVWFAMYRFRLDVNRLVATTGPHPHDLAREHAMGSTLVWNGMALAAALLVVLAVRARQDNPPGSRASAVRRMVPVALVVTLAYEAVSIAMGRDYWSHYMVQLVVPLALGAGLAAGRHRVAARGVTILIAASAVVSVLATGRYPLHLDDIPAGQAIARVSHPGDTIATVGGHAELVHASGLPDPYPYLWETPQAVLDPRLTLLATTLRGPRAPTWLVVQSVTSLAGSREAPLRRVVAHDYHRVAGIDGTTIYLRDGEPRATPTQQHGG